MRMKQLYLILWLVLSLGTTSAVGQLTAKVAPAPPPNAPSGFRGTVRTALGAPYLEQISFREMPRGDRRRPELIRIAPDKNGNFVSDRRLPARFTVETTPACVELSKLVLDVPQRGEQTSLGLGINFDQLSKTFSMNNVLSVTNLATLTRFKDTFGGINLGCPNRKHSQGGNSQ